MASKFVKLFIVILFAILILLQGFCMPCMAQQKGVSVIRWSCLELSDVQKSKIKYLDLQWQMINSALRIQILNDQKKLRYLLRNPFALDRKIRKIQNRILQNQNKLRYEAMENFLQKRNTLNYGQRMKLHKLISN